MAAVPLAEGARVLEAGAGTGFATIAIARRVGPTGRVLAVDISEGMLAEAQAAITRERLHNVELKQEDATALDWCAPSSFDAAVCASALLYMPVDAALAAWHRVLVPGGLVAFSTMREDSPPAAAAFRRCAEEMFGMRLNDPGAELGSPERCERALERAGFVIEKIVEDAVEFSPDDLSLAWESNFRAPAHAPVRSLTDAEIESLRECYSALLAERIPDLAFRCASVLYAIARKPEQGR